MRNRATLTQKGFVAASVTAVVVYVILYVSSSQHRQALGTLDSVVFNRFKYLYRAVQAPNDSVVPKTDLSATKALRNTNRNHTDVNSNRTQLTRTVLKMTINESEMIHVHTGNVEGSATRVAHAGQLLQSLNANTSKNFNSSFSTNTTDSDKLLGKTLTKDLRTTKVAADNDRKGVEPNKNDLSRHSKLRQDPKLQNGSKHDVVKGEAFRHTLDVFSSQQEKAEKRTAKYSNASRSVNGSPAANSSPLGSRVTVRNDHSSTRSCNSNNCNNVSITTTNTNTQSSVKATAGALDHSDPCEGVADNETLTLTSGSSRPVRPPRYLIYKCDATHGYCGGWSDRQRGMVSVFLLALATCRRFGVVMTTPCPITNFLRPHQVNWTVAKALTRDRPFVFLNDVTDRQNLTRRLREMDFNKEYPHDVVYLRTNSPSYLSSLLSNPRYRRRLPDWTRQSDAKVFSAVWGMLVQPTEDMQISVDSYLREARAGANATGNSGSQRPLVCAHVRMGKSETIQNDAVRTDTRELPALLDFLQPYANNGSQIFLATDSYQVRNLTRQRFGASVRHTGGPIVHVDRQARQPDACDGFRAALLDQLILARCDVLVITHSGFGLRAAYLRAREDNLFYFSGGQVRPQTLAR